MNPNNRDKLIVILTIDDLIMELNQAMRVRKVSLRIDYTNHRPLLLMSMPGSPVEAWMVTDTRKKTCVHLHPVNDHLALFLSDANERLAKLGGSLFLVGYKPAQGKPIAKLQVCIEGSENTAVTLASTPKGQLSPPMTHFIPPERKA